MPRAKRGFKRRRRINKLKERTKGFVMGGHSQVRRGAEQADRAGVYAFRDRRVKKRTFRQLWIARLSVAANEQGISYSRLIAALTKANIKLDRKVLSEISMSDPTGFATIVDQVRSLAPAN
jgi:large subunit ribosomal protein L20